ncbi:hypothetical protein BD410DRAFT_473714 [Rickenella mellea]|uniref:Pentacotripeptide-repeat region of PRORP domain-containing protein n=1 Tax=Rickenella mellea TaxID=50990 RepID=A0A4Y7QI20_9AGAM|nr:hypothetical protein BD410DRAFT_473714 [Rickenella mellea]
MHGRTFALLRQCKKFWRRTSHQRALGKFAPEDTQTCTLNSNTDPNDQARRIIQRIHSVEAELSPEATHPIELHDFEHWRELLLAPNLDIAVRRLSTHVTSNDHPEGITVTHGDRGPLPTWVLIYLLSTKIYTQDQANMGLAIAHQHMPFIEDRFQPFILVLATRALAKRQVIAPLSDVVKSFLELPFTHQPSEPRHFNLMLRAMSHFHPAVTVAKLTTAVLNTMEARQIRLESNTYHSLLRNRLVTLELTKSLEARMKREGFIPNAEHLETFLRIYGKHGVIHHAGRYLGTIRKMKRRRGHVAPYGNQFSPSTDTPNPDTIVTRHTTAYLRSFAFDRASAFEYLRRLVASEQQHSNPSESTRVRSARHVSHRPGKRSIDHYDWTTLLHIAALDKHTNTPALLRLFNRCKSTSFGQNIAASTAVMGGLLKRQEFSAAEEVWRTLRTTDRVDNKALTMGLYTLVRAGHVHEAFETLEEFSEPRQSTGTSDGREILPDTALINSLMKSLLHSDRPDLVFRVWECMEALYSVKPNAESLTILLNSAFFAAKFDHSLDAVWKHIRFHLSFGGPESNEIRTSRTEVLRAIMEQIGSETKPVHVTSFWGSAPAGVKARDVFREIVLGNWPDLRNTEVPAQAVWSDGAQTQQPVRNMVRHIAGTAMSLIFPPPPPPQKISSLNEAVLTKANILPLGQYPQIVPNEKAFRAYIELLGELDHSSEIPLTLTWMRRLEVLPTPETLSVALVLWAGVSLRGPLIEKWEGRSEYVKLLRWLQYWLGKDRLPSDQQLARAMQHLLRKRRATGGMQ